MDSYEICIIFFMCCAAFAIAYRTVCLIISRRRAEKLGILRVKYAIWARSEIVLFVLTMAVFGYAVIINAVHYIPSSFALLEEYRENFSQDPELYSERIEFVLYSIKTQKYQIVTNAIVIAMDLLMFLTRGAYITKEGVVLFGTSKPLMTTARIKQDAIKFYTRSLREAEKGRKYQHAFDLPESEDNCELFRDFIKTTGAKA